MKTEFSTILRTTGRILTFRATREDFDDLNYRHLIFGLLCTWLVGFGRTWDKPEVSLLQRTGLGSVAYIFVLSALLWLVIHQFATPGSSYKRLLTFVSLVSPPGLIYAIPVEMFLPASTAASVNLIFLLIVAVWRVALLFSYMRIAEGLRGRAVLVLTLYPLAIIVMALTPFSLVAIVLGKMAGIENSPAEARTQQIVDQVSLALIVLSWCSAPFLSSAYSAMHRVRRSVPKRTGREPAPKRNARYENPKTGDW